MFPGLPLRWSLILCKNVKMFNHVFFPPRAREKESQCQEMGSEIDLWTLTYLSSYNPWTWCHVGSWWERAHHHSIIIIFKQEHLESFLNLPGLTCKASLKYPRFSLPSKGIPENWREKTYPFHYHKKRRKKLKIKTNRALSIFLNHSSHSFLLQDICTLYKYVSLWLVT